MKILKKISFSLFLLISLSYLFIVLSPKIIKDFYPFGIRTAIVLTGSMEPTLEINDFVIMKRPKEIKINDIISYRQTNSGNEVIHRIISIKNNQIITKGDSNNIEDKPIDVSQVTGIFVGKIKYLGNIIFFMQKPIVFSIVITAFFVIIIIPSNEASSLEIIKNKDKQQSIIKISSDSVQKINEEINNNIKSDENVNLTVSLDEKLKQNTKAHNGSLRKKSYIQKDTNNNNGKSKTNAQVNSKPQKSRTRQNSSLNKSSKI